MHSDAVGFLVDYLPSPSKTQFRKIKNNRRLLRNLNNSIEELVDKVKASSAPVPLTETFSVRRKNLPYLRHLQEQLLRIERSVLKKTVVHLTLVDMVSQFLAGQLEDVTKFLKKDLSMLPLCERKVDQILVSLAHTGEYSRYGLHLTKKQIAPLRRLHQMLVDANKQSVCQNNCFDTTEELLSEVYGGKLTHIHDYRVPIHASSKQRRGGSSKKKKKKKNRTKKKNPTVVQLEARNLQELKDHLCYPGGLVQFLLGFFDDGGQYVLEGFLANKGVYRTVLEGSGFYVDDKTGDLYTGVNFCCGKAKIGRIHGTKIHYGQTPLEPDMLELNDSVRFDICWHMEQQKLVVKEMCQIGGFSPRPKKKRIVDTSSIALYLRDRDTKKTRKKLLRKKKRDRQLLRKRILRELVNHYLEQLEWKTIGRRPSSSSCSLWDFFSMTDASTGRKLFTLDQLEGDFEMVYARRILDDEEEVEAMAQMIDDREPGSLYYHIVSKVRLQDEQRRLRKEEKQRQAEERQRKIQAHKKKIY